MSGYFCRDGANGERETCATLEEALELGAITIGYYRREAVLDTEWVNEVEDVEVGVVAESGIEEDDIVTHKATAFGNDEDGYDYRMEAFEAAEVTEARPGPSI